MRARIIAAFALLFAFPGLAFAQQGKPVVAIYQMDDLASTGKADMFSRMIETTIASTGKFRVIERERLGKLVGEQTRARAGLVTTNQPGRVGGFEGADYLIYGSITSVSVARKANIGMSMLGGLVSNRNEATPQCSNAVVTLSIDIKITDADTGEIKYVTRIDETQKSAAVCNGTPQIDHALLFRAAADKISTALVTTIFPIQIAAVQGDGTIILNYGEGAVAVGRVMGVFTKGQAIIDPATKERIGDDEQLIGLIQITDVTPRFSKAVATAGFDMPPAVGAIVRPATPNDITRFRKRKR